MHNNEKNRAPFYGALIFISVQYIVSICIASFFLPHGDPAADFIIIFVYYAVILALPVFLAAGLILKRKPAQYLGFKKNAGKGILYGALICLFISAVFFAANRFVIKLRDFSGRTLWMLSGLVLAGLFEEIPFRGFYQSILREKLGFWPANLIVSALFSAMHLSRALSEVLFLLPLYFGISIWLGYIYEKANSLWAPILVHACFNVLTAVF